MPTVSLALAALLVIAAGCDESTTEKPSPSAQGVAASPSTAPSVPVPADLVLAEAPSGAKDVSEVRKTAKDGDTVVIRGRVGGREEPFTSGAASFLLIDAKVKSCAEMEGDMGGETCKTPWDFCCEPKETVAANTVTVQVVGPDGKPLTAPLQGVGGLKPLSEVSVKGEAHKGKGSDELVVNATGLYVKGG